MYKQSYKTIIVLIVFLFVMHSEQLYAISGKISNNKGENVPNATLVFVNTLDSSKKFTVITDQNGFYDIALPLINIENSSEFLVFNSYPNPFTSGTVIPFYIPEEAKVKVGIYNTIGQEVAIPFEGILTSGIHQIVWDGLSSAKQRLPQGFYYSCVYYKDKMLSQKLIRMFNDTHSQLPSPVPLNYDVTQTESIKYDIVISAVNHNTLKIFDVVFINETDNNYTLTKKSPVPYACVGNYIGVENNSGVYKPIFLNGINLGVAVPGTLPGEMAATRQQYRDWFEQMADIGFNAIRVYTLHFPRFYEELAYYNSQHPEKPLYVMHGVWLDEEGINDNFYSYSANFDDAIKEIIDCVHGNRNIAERPGRAFGNYTTDISQWVIGYIIGREIHPPEVLNTDIVNSSHTSYIGTAVKMSNGTPTAVWFTERIDKLIMYERQTYGVERPVSQSSWPTLDPLSHPTEVDDSTEDIASIDMSGISTFNAPAGYFASYHAYPYFPDFISEQPNYQSYSDDYGPNSYYGYLSDLKQHYASIPLVIAEYGVPSNWANAHTAHSGMNHGGETEIEQGEFDVRLLKNIYESQCGGGFLFAWIDEWFKNFWITEPIGSTLDRRPLWNNKLSAEENFGLIGFDVPPPDYSEWAPVNANCFITKVNADYDHEFFYIKLGTQTQLSASDTIWVGLDTYDKELGELVMPNGKYVENRVEFALQITTTSAQIFVTEAYNLFGIWHHVSGPEQLYHSIPTEGKPWFKVQWKNNHWDDAIVNIGKLKTRLNTGVPSSLDGVVIYPDRVEIRFPWTLINFTDPSRREVMHDNRSTPLRETAISDGIALTVFKGSCAVQTQRLIWNQWNVAPDVVERKKAAYFILRNAYHSIEFLPF